MNWRVAFLKLSLVRCIEDWIARIFSRVCQEKRSHSYRLLFQRYTQFSFSAFFFSLHAYGTSNECWRCSDEVTIVHIVVDAPRAIKMRRYIMKPWSLRFFLYLRKFNVLSAVSYLLSLLKKNYSFLFKHKQD